MKRREMIGTLCLAVAILGAPLGIRAVDAASAGYAFHRLDDAALAAVTGGKTCECVDHDCAETTLPFACKHDADAIFRKCYGCDPEFELFSPAKYDVCTRTSGSGCCDNEEEDCVPKCEKKCPPPVKHYAYQECSNSTQN